MGLFKKKKNEEKKEEKLSDSERLDIGQVQVRTIVELFGKPRKHVQDSLKTYVTKLKIDPEAEIIKEEFSKPKKQGDLYSMFVELEIWFKDVPKLIDFCFDYMPSSVEIIKPQKFEYNNDEFAGMLNDLQAKLHQLDMIVKNLKMENLNLKNNAGNLIRNIFNLSLKKKSKTLDEISVDVGIPIEDLKNLIKVLLKEGRIVLKDNKYILPGK
ncbi:hypothetical protein HQ529_02800 [Candidatus Woesearchaeota archaeon]|nr:hypothetical protein [Candidatus Woesearchaeota archaeon]